MDINLISSITGLPLAGVDPTSFFAGKEHDPSLVRRIKENVGLRADPGFILLSSHQQKDPQCWPFWQQPANRLQSHPKQLWGAAKPGFCKQKRDITLPLALTTNIYTK